ncbi:MAG TPA: sigma-54 dependent transcriptional regulator [Thermoanaerobaculia bacterium]|jgi:DNA-binding NtrC family response regulator|nr:sigma-54 dependent transcriptional regulator [Thermoanaerobaculia bacterium]
MANVLIVDDERPIRRILSVLLQERHHRVAEAGSGEEALAAMTGGAADAKPDLVLLDLKLPGIDGLETLKRLRALKPRLDVVMMTAHGTISSAVDAMRRGAFDYVTKPFDNDELLMVVDRALEMRRLSSEVEALREDLEARYGFSEIVGVSREIQEIFRLMAKVVRVDVTVLVTGESGTGKELVARAIHRRSARVQGPFVAVNCSAIPQTLVESEFFGHEKGAFTDARESRPGRFEQADGGTLFLDEVGDLALDAQAKLLRALQERQIQRVGGRGSRPVDVRVVAATNKDLEKESREGRFREDLFWRLNVMHIRIPSLRERPADLPLLIDHFVDRFNRELGLAVEAIAPDARQLLCEHGWPGNVRELENTICRAMILCEGDTLTLSDLPGRVRGETSGEGGQPRSDLSGLSLADAVAEATERLEKVMILARLADHQGSRTATAESLGVSRKTLFNKMRQYGISGEESEEGA